MIYRFETFELDTAQMELRANGAAVAAEPQVFALLQFLIEQRDRVVTKEEIIEQIWDGRIISDSAIASRIKSARQALGDDGAAQHFIRTVHGVGFRFVAEVAVAAAPSGIAVGETPSEPRLVSPPQLDLARPSIAVLPFRYLGGVGPYAAIADALPDDLITELSRLRWLFVIARASSFRFRGEADDIDRVRTALNVRYCLSGIVEILGGAMTVSVELCDTNDRGIVWADRFRAEIGAVHEVREDIVRAVTNALELQIPLHEAQLARLKTPEHLDAWSAYHLGLQYMYRFNKADNEAATAMFERAVALEPGFARAYAGLSFTSFQDVILHYVDEIDEAAQRAQRYAEECLQRDPIDPFGNFTMGRVFLLRSDLDGSLPWFDRANALNPNYAQAKYARAWPQALLGHSAESQTDVDAALALSPIDPLAYAMLAVRAFSHMDLDESAEAAAWSERAARAPGAHALISMIAVIGHGMNGDDARARAWAAITHRRAPQLSKADFLRAFPFRSPRTSKRITQTLEKYGF